MKLGIFYTSSTGSTKQYCEWLHQEFPKSHLYDLKTYDFIDFNNFDLIVIGSPVRGGTFESTEFLIPHIEQLKGKKILMMAVGAVPQEEKWSQNSYNKIPEALREKFTEYIKLPGLSKEPKGLEKFLFKFILKVDINKVVVQDKVKKRDLDKVVEWVKIITNNGEFNTNSRKKN